MKTSVFKISEVIDSAAAQCGWSEPPPRQLIHHRSLRLNIYHAPGQPQRLRPKGGGGMNGLHDLAQLVYKFVYLPLGNHQWRGHFQHLKIVATNLRENALIAEEVHHQHLSKHSRMDSLE